MPLIKSASKKALQENIKTEMEANPSPKDRKRNIAIAYSTRRQAMAKKRKMAQGGEVKAASMRPDADEHEKRSMEMLDGHEHEHMHELDARSEHMDRETGEHDEDMLEGAPHAHKAELRANDEHMVTEDDRDEMEMDMYAHGGSVADKIRHAAKMMAEGGKVDLDHNSDEDLNNLDDMDYEAARKHTYYDDEQLSAQPEDSNEHGHELSDEDKHDMVGAIRKKMKMKKM